MALVDYSDSDSDSDSVREVKLFDDHVGGLDRSGLKRKRLSNGLERDEVSDLPLLPSAFHDLYASTSRASPSDDPKLHGGRQRSSPHVEGNWPTHVYLECKSECRLLHLAVIQETPSNGNEGIQHKQSPSIYQT